MVPDFICRWDILKNIFPCPKGEQMFFRAHRQQKIEEHCVCTFPLQPSLKIKHQWLLINARNNSWNAWEWQDWTPMCITMENHLKGIFYKLGDIYTVYRISQLGCFIILKFVLIFLQSFAVWPICLKVGLHYTFLRSRGKTEMALKITINMVISLFDRGDSERWHLSRHFLLKWYSHSFEDRSRGSCLEFAMFKNGRNTLLDSMTRH